MCFAVRIRVTITRCEAHWSARTESFAAGSLAFGNGLNDPTRPKISPDMLSCSPLFHLLSRAAYPLKGINFLPPIEWTLTFIFRKIDSNSIHFFDSTRRQL
jgi:hypothetical protein